METIHSYLGEVNMRGLLTSYTKFSTNAPSDILIQRNKLSTWQKEKENLGCTS